MEVKLIDKGATVAEDYVAGTVHVEYDNTDVKLFPFKNRVIEWWRKADDTSFENVRIYETKNRDKWVDEQEHIDVEKSMHNLIKRHLIKNKKYLEEA